MPSTARVRERQLSAHEVSRVTSYVPDDISEADWATISDFCAETFLAFLALNEPLTDPRGSFRKWTRYVRWAHLVQGRPLNRDVICWAPVVSAYIVHGMADMSSSSRASHRAMLVRVIRALRPGESGIIAMATLPKHHAEPPYTPLERRQMRAWAWSHKTPYSRAAAWSMITFGLGAGLRAQELSLLRREDVIEDGLGVHVLINGSYGSPRVVPVRADFEDMAMVLAQAVTPGSFVFRPDRGNTNKNAVAAWMSRLEPAREGFTINMTRLRGTWIVDQLNNGIPAMALVYAAGVDSFASFDRYRPYVSPEVYPSFVDQMRTVRRQAGRDFAQRNREAVNARQRAAHHARRERLAQGLR